MPRARPQLSITLPRNFTFHYTEGDEPPRTPERELAAPKPPSPQAYRIKRRPRPKITPSHSYDQFNLQYDSQDVPIPTIEAPVVVEQIRPRLQQRVTEPAEGYLAPVSSRRFMTSPRTPSAQFDLFHNGWNSVDQQNIGESISRPMSAFSISSDSSDSSNGSSASLASQGGSCTSPESDAPNPFSLASSKKAGGKETPATALCDPMVVQKHVPKKKRVLWSPEMDKHLWSTYLLYLRDPTVTPFKAVPGSTPPLGVCHRVAREARRTWRRSRIIPSQTSETLGTPTSRGAEDVFSRIKPAGSPDTIKADRSGSNTPTAPIIPKVPVWPKSGASTRRRLRELSKRKASIAPYYQRLLETRSPSPFASSSRSESQSSRVPSPFSARKRSPFSTRDIQISLATSTAASMQPDGPLAQLARSSSNEGSSDEWFNDPIEPFVSQSTAAFDQGLGIGGLDMEAELPSLGSPFTYHTWGPSRYRQHLRPTVPRTQSEIVSNPGQTLMSPVRLHKTLPHPSVLKRRAQHQLEEELSPGGADIRRNFLENLFASPAESSHRRVRSRGFSLGDVNNTSDLTSLFTPPTMYDQMTSPELAEAAVMESNSLAPLSTTESMKRLGSPFAGIDRRPSRKGSSRHMATASLSAYDPSHFTSIDQMLGQLQSEEAVTKRRRG